MVTTCHYYLPGQVDPPPNWGRASSVPGTQQDLGCASTATHFTLFHTINLINFCYSSDKKPDSWNWKERSFQTTNMNVSVFWGGKSAFSYLCICEGRVQWNPHLPTSIFCWDEDHPPLSWRQVGVAIMWFLDGVMEFWCADPRRSPTSLSVAPTIYSAVLCFKLFGYVREGKPYLCTSICSGTIRLHYWSPNISFSVENVQIQAVCDWLHAESCSAGSVLSENELRPCSVTGAAWWPLNQHLSPRRTEIRPQSGRTSAPTDDLLFYLEQRQPEERWHMAFRANHSLLWGEQEFHSLPHQQPGALLHVWILSGWSFLNVFYLFPLGPHLWHNDWTSLAQEVEAVHQSSLNLIPSLLQILVAPLPEPTCSVFHPSGISTPSLKSPMSKYSLLDSSTTIVHPFRCTEGNPRKRWKGKGPQPPFFPVKHTSKAGIYDQSKQGISIWAGESDPELGPLSGCWWQACSRPSDTTMGSKLGSSLKSG